MQESFHARLGHRNLPQGPVDTLNGERQALVRLALFLNNSIVGLVLVVLYLYQGC